MYIQTFVNNCYQDMLDFENHELYTHDKKEAMEYIIRCLANPLCNGSFVALEAINRQRFNIDSKNNYDCDTCRYDCWKNNRKIIKDRCGDYQKKNILTSKEKKMLVYKLKNDTKRGAMECKITLIEEDYNYEKAKEKLLKHVNVNVL